MKNYWKYPLIVVLGLVMGGLASGLDASFRFVPQRAFLRAIRLYEHVPGWRVPVEKIYPTKPVRVVVESGVSLLLDPGDYLGQELLIRGTWQPQVWQSISDGLSPGAVFFDVGAHIGYDSLRASVKVGDRGKVVSFEPNLGTLEQLRANIAASHASNVTVEAIACTDKEQILTLYDSTLAGNSMASSLSLANADQEKHVTLPSYPVRGRRIDDVVPELGLNRLDVIKADVEGAEVLVIRGAVETLRRFHPKVVLEVVPSSLANLGTSLEELTRTMTELGYGDPKQVDDTDWEWTPR